MRRYSYDQIRIFAMIRDRVPEMDKISRESLERLAEMYMRELTPEEISLLRDNYTELLEAEVQELRGLLARIGSYAKRILPKEK